MPRDPADRVAGALIEKIGGPTAIKAIADRYGVSIKAAGLQFSLANPAVDAVIPGASRPQRIAEALARAAAARRLACPRRTLALSDRSRERRCGAK